jgi:hypothetical protein
MLTAVLLDRPPELIVIFAMVAACVALFLATFVVLFVRGLRATAPVALAELTVDSLATAQAKLELVLRPGAPFLSQILTLDRNGNTPPVNAVEWFIGVRNTSPTDAAHNVRVQAVTATQATRGLPAVLPPRDGPTGPFSLAPGEMRLVRFIRQRTEVGKRPGLATIGAGDGLDRVPCLTPCEMVIATYADGTSSLQTVSLSLNDKGEIRIRPPVLGELPGGVEPKGYARLSWGPAEPKEP